MPYDSDGWPADASVWANATPWNLNAYPGSLSPPPGKLADGTDDPGDWITPPKLANGADDLGDSIGPSLSSFPRAGAAFGAPSAAISAAFDPTFDPFAAYRSSIPANRAWAPTNSPSALGFPYNNSGPVWPPPRPGAPQVPYAGILEGLRHLGAPSGEIPDAGILEGVRHLGPQPGKVPYAGILEGLRYLGARPGDAPPSLSAAQPWPQATAAPPTEIASANWLRSAGIPLDLSELGASTAAAESGASSGDASNGGATPAMPSTYDALFQGFRAANQQLMQSVQSATGVPTEYEASPAAEPFGWSDLAHPSRIAPKLAYQLAQSYPTVAGGVAGAYVGGEVGSLAGPEGTFAGALAGGAVGAATLSAAQTLGPSYLAELQRTPDDPDGAWDRAVHQAEVSGVFSGAAWTVFPARFFTGPVKNLAFQIFGVQPALSVGRRVASNIIDDQPATEGTSDAYGQGVVSGLANAGGHALLQQVPRVSALLRREDNQPPPPPFPPPPTEPAFSPTPPTNGRGVWDLPIANRGRELEQLFGHNLHPNYPTIDIWDEDTGAVTSIKSIDLEAPTYEVQGRYNNALYSRLSKNINDLAEYQGGRYAGIPVPGDKITSRALTVIVPGKGTDAQEEVLRNITEVGRQRGVAVKIEVYR
jgi:hypothetical protein